MSKANISNVLLIERIFAARPERMWKAWTEPGMFKKWWGPKDFTCPSSTIDLQVGGKYLHCMRGPDGKEYWSTGTYKEIVPMKKLVVTDSFADENGNVVPSTHYGMEDFPLELEVTVTFDAVEDITRMTLQHVGLPEDAREDCNTGWNQSFDKLVEIL